MMTDGFLIMLYMRKVYSGVRYLYIVYFLPKMEYQYLEEHGDLKWHTRRVKRMRIEFKNYFLSSCVATVFIILQTSLLLLVIWSDLDAFFRYGLLLINAVIQCYLMLFPIRQHIKELDEQVTYRIKRYRSASEKTKVTNSVIQSVLFTI